MTEIEKKKVVPIIIEGVEINGQNVTFQKLQEFSLTLYAKLLNQRKERNFLILEREKLKTILENTRHEIEEANSILTNKDDEIEQIQERNCQEIKDTEQEVKYIQYDHMIRLNEYEKCEKNVLIKTDVEHLEEEAELLQERKQLKADLHNENLTTVENLIKHDKKNIEEIENLKEKHKEIQLKNERELMDNFNHAIEHLTMKHEMEVFELEERRNAHLAQLKLINTKRTNEMKSFFNSVISECLAVISDLKQNICTLKNNKSVMSAEMKHLKKENKSLQKQLDKARSEVNTLKIQLINYKKVLVSLKNNKCLLNLTETGTKNIELTSISKIKRIKEKENVGSSETLDSNLFNTTTNLSNCIVEKRHYLEELVLTLIKEISNKQKIVKDLNCVPDTEIALSELKFEYWNPRELSYEFAVMCKAHDDLLKTLQGKLQELCVPGEDLDNILLDIVNVGKTTSSFISKQ